MISTNLTDWGRETQSPTAWASAVHSLAAPIARRPGPAEQPAAASGHPLRTLGAGRGVTRRHFIRAIRIKGGYGRPGAQPQARQGRVERRTCCLGRRAAPRPHTTPLRPRRWGEQREQGVRRVHPPGAMKAEAGDALRAVRPVRLQQLAPPLQRRNANAHQRARPAGAAPP